MYLKDFNQMVKCRFFDKEKGLDDNLRYVEEVKTSGFCTQKDFGSIAVYPDNGELVVQINANKWNLLSDSVDVDYFHVYDKKLTTFRIFEQGKKFDLTYTSWWADRDDFDVDPMAASCEEKNSEEDIFGYLKMLKENKEAANNLLGLWSKNIGQ